MFSHIPISDKTVWEATIKQWKIDAEAFEEGAFIAADVERKLTALKKEAETQQDIHCYFIVKKGETVASSLLETSYAMPKSSAPWVKLLDITLRPSLLTLEREKLREAYIILAYSITHAIDLIFNEHPSNLLKILGRTVEMLGLLQAIVSTGEIDSVAAKYQLDAKIEGKWLVLAKRKN